MAKQLTTVVRVMSQDRLEFQLRQTVAGFTRHQDAVDAVNYLNLHTWNNQDHSTRMEALAKWDVEVESDLYAAGAHYSDLSYELSTLTVFG